LRVESTSRSRAFSPVISIVIISAVVLACGGAIWAFSQGAMTITAEDYAEAVVNTTDTVCERFIIEHVSYNGTYLHVWIYNYGDVDIEVKIQVGSVSHPDEWIEIEKEGFAEVQPLRHTAEKGDELIIRAYTRRENNVYYRYLVP